jgi:hypothetical protein
VKLTAHSLSVVQDAKGAKIVFGIVTPVKQAARFTGQARDSKNKRIGFAEGFVAYYKHWSVYGNQLANIHYGFFSWRTWPAPLNVFVFLFNRGGLGGSVCFFAEFAWLVVRFLICLLALRLVPCALGLFYWFSQQNRSRCGGDHVPGLLIASQDLRRALDRFG